MPHAFKDLIIHEIPQFILHIAIRYVLHHHSSQDIHHCKIFEDWWIFKKNCKMKGRTDRGRCGTGIVRAIKNINCDRGTWRKINLDIDVCWKQNMRANDPSAGSPTETLLRLLLPLNVKVYSTFRKKRRNCKSRSPKYSPEHSIGRSDGRCVQRAGT